MSRRRDRSWLVLESIEDDEHVRCVDLFLRPDGSFGFEAFRRDVEDRGTWTPTQFFSGGRFGTRTEALAAAVGAVPWLSERMRERRL